MVVGSRQKIQIRNVYHVTKGYCEGAIVRVNMGNNRDKHEIVGNRIAKLNSQMNDGERTKAVYMQEEGEQFVVHEHLGKFPVVLTEEEDKVEGNKPILVQVTSGGNYYRLKVAGCMSYSDFHYVARTATALPKIGTFVKFLVRHDNYATRMEDSHKIFKITQLNVKAPDSMLLPGYPGIEISIIDGRKYGTFKQRDVDTQYIGVVKLLYCSFSEKTDDLKLYHPFFGWIYDERDKIKPIYEGSKTLRSYPTIHIRKMSSVLNTDPWIITHKDVTSNRHDEIAELFLELYLARRKLKISERGPKRND
ncbi:hypothetical protein WR25_04258 [Diploscapter pachys]|uniref:Uncharacterized protein n=1 Tax=Diploscapter pachys TaxID=2018661 RepID=A0A2A2K1K6_9BILA|nr:hypothetical protein WR25_04258 [Diploscapter pachys]